MRPINPDLATLVGGAPFDAGDINLAVTYAPYLVGVDSGADRILAAGRMPDRVYGDMDSLSEKGKETLREIIVPISEQVTTDFDKALRNTAAGLALAVGFSGGRLDHELAVLNALARNAAHACIVIGAESLTFLCPPELAIGLPDGTPLSLFPMGTAEVRSNGLLWPTDGLSFAPDGRVGTSNEVTGPVVLRPSGPAMLVILPRPCLEIAVGALLQAPRWQ